MLDKEWVEREREKMAKQSPDMDTQGGAKLDYLALHISNGRLWG